jgi:hypothetical protein
VVSANKLLVSKTSINFSLSFYLHCCHDKDKVQMKFLSSLVVTAVTIALSSVVAVSAKPRNDECVGAKVVPSTSLPYNEVVQIVDYTYNPSDLNNTCSNRNDDGAIIPDGRTAWWQFTPPTDGLLTLRVKSSRSQVDPGLDLIISAFTGSCGTSNLIELECIDGFDTFENLYSPVRAGKKYFF